MAVIFNPFVEQRRLHKLRLLDLIKKNPTLDREQIIAVFSLQTGLKRATIKEYLSELEESGISMTDERVPDKVRDEGSVKKDKQPDDGSA